MKFILLTAMAFMFAFSMPNIATAQSIEFSKAVQDLRNMNRLDPRQSPQFKTSEEVMKGHVLDRTRKTVGEVHDVIVGSSGAIEQLHVEFDRLQLSTEVYISYADMGVQPTSSGFITSFEDEQIQAVFPELLAGIATASGAENLYSTNKLLGRQVRSVDGRVLGKVDEVLFDGQGGRASALLVKMDFGRLTGTPLAIPFGVANVNTSSAQIKVLVEKQMADAMISVAEDLK